VNEHVHGDNTFVPTHMHKTKTKKESKTNNSNKKTGKAKHGAFPRLPENYKNKAEGCSGGSIQCALGHDA
jgi:ABC-type branched-subunit amino acid transport system ATPase component